MLNLPTEVQNSLAQRQGVVSRVLFWITAKNRTTGALENFGIWNGEDTRVFVIDGQSRVYVGGGSFLNIDDLTSEAALNIRSLDLDFSSISPELIAIVRQYDAKFAPTQIHLAFFDPESNNLLAPPTRMHKGWVNKFPIKTAAVGGQSTARLSIVGHTRLLTKTLGAKRSNENQKTRNSDDTFFQHVAITGTIQTSWGSKTVGAASPNSLQYLYGMVGAGDLYNKMFK